MCGSAIWKSIIPAVAIIGMVIGATFLPRWSDFYGRRIIFGSSVTAQSIFLLAIYFTTSKYVVVAMMPFFGMSLIGRITGGFFFLVEHMPRKSQPIMGGLVMFGEGMAVVVWDIYFYYISHDYSYFWIMMICMSFISSIFVWFIPESPLYCYGVGDL